MAAYTDLDQAIFEIETAADTGIALHTEFAETFRAATQTPLQVRNLRASFVGLIREIRDVRRRLDATQIVDLIVNPNDEAVVINFGRWERDQRSFFSKLLIQSRLIIDILVSLEQGPERRIVISKSNETLQIIALRELGSQEDWQVLLDANPDLAPGLLPSGTVIIIPERR